MKTRRLIAILIASFLFGKAATRTLGQETSWKGESVIYTKASNDIKFGDIVAGEQVYFALSGVWPMSVRDDREGWLRVHDGRREGWVDKADFVLVRDAPACFHRRLQADPTDRWALFMRGAGWSARGEHDNALKDFDECIRLNPTDSGVFNARGNVWRRKKQFDKAIKDYDEAIRLNPTNATAFNNRGFARNEKKEFAKAMEDLDEAIRLDPKYPTPFYNKACGYALQGQNDRALDELSKALELGYGRIEAIEKDSDLDSIREHRRYAELLKKYSK